jgi:zinc-ribbon domain
LISFAMFCRKCGSELRNDARFCNRCGVPISNQPGQGDFNDNRRQTLDLPRGELPFRNTSYRAQAKTDRLPAPPLNAPPAPPVKRPPPKKPSSEVLHPAGARLEARTQNDLPSHINPSRSNTIIENQVATTPISLHTRREPDAKPFFTQALTTESNPQHRRLVTVVPLLLLVVILLFVFAYIAGR